MHLGVIFLAVGGLDAAYPEAFELRRRDARARLGRSALLGALATIALIALHEQLFRWLAVRFPDAATAHGLSAPLERRRSAAGAARRSAGPRSATIIGSAVVGLLAMSLRGMTWRPWLPGPSRRPLSSCQGSILRPRRRRCR